MKVRVIEKILSSNDVGQTGGHQAGILVPKNPLILAFFPNLDASAKNPRIIINMLDDLGNDWTFRFIYYNNRFFGGTRNEYRLTGMTTYFKQFNLKAGDTLVFRNLSTSQFTISFRRVARQNNTIKLSSLWKVVEADT